MFESFDQLILGFGTGIVFGFLLQKGQVTKYDRILGQLLLRDWTVVKIMGTAIVVGAAGVYFLVSRDAASLDIWPFLPAGMLIGAVCFGIGLALFGYCPGTGLAASGEGSRDAMAGVAGMLFSACVFVVAYPWLDPIVKSLGDRGKITFPDVLGVSPWPAIAAVAIAMAVAAVLLERGRQTR